MRFVYAFVAAFVAFFATTVAQDQKAVNPDRWDEATPELMATFPVPYGRRINTPSAYARHIPYRVHVPRDRNARH